MHFLLAQAIKCELDGNIDKLFNRIAQQTVGTDGTPPLSDAARDTTWSLLPELANNDQHLYPNTPSRLYVKLDPVLVYFGLKDRGRLPENYKHPEIIEWNLFQSGLCKCLLGIDPQPERDMICDVRLVSPGRGTHRPLARWKLTLRSYRRRPLTHFENACSWVLNRRWSGCRVGI